jgi:hypothetical protein
VPGSGSPGRPTYGGPGSKAALQRIASLQLRGPRRPTRQPSEFCAEGLGQSRFGAIRPGAGSGVLRMEDRWSPVGGSACDPVPGRFPVTIDGRHGACGQSPVREAVRVDHLPGSGFSRANRASYALHRRQTRKSAEREPNRYGSTRFQSWDDISAAPSGSLEVRVAWLRQNEEPLARRRTS